MRDLEQYLKDCAVEGIIDFSIRATVVGENGVNFYIRPDSKNGDTVDFSVSGNLLKTESDTGHNPAVKPDRAKRVVSIACDSPDYVTPPES